MDTEGLTREIKDVARRSGAALVGVAPVERFDPMPPAYDSPPEGQHPADFIPDARSVVSFAMPILPAVLDAPAVLAEKDNEMVPPEVRMPYFETVYNRVGHVLHDNHLELIGQMIGQRLLEHGFNAMIFPTTGVHPGMGGKTRAEIWADSPFHYSSGPFSHRHAATRAGLGEFGYSNVVLTPRFGPRQRFNSVVTDARLQPDKLLEEPLCLRNECKLCLKACVMGCISLRSAPVTGGDPSLDGEDRARVFIDTPSQTGPLSCMSRTARCDDPPVRGDCLRICPLPRPPERLPARLEAIRQRHGGR